MPVPICPRSTNEGTMDANEGIDSASVTPTTNDSTMIIHGWTAPVSSNTTSNVGHNIWSAWKPKMIFRRSPRSASTPPTSVNPQAGASIAKASRPTRNDEPLSESISHGCATCCAQVPMFERRLATQNVPKRRVRSRAIEARKVSAVPGTATMAAMYGIARHRLGEAPV